MKNISGKLRRLADALDSSVEARLARIERLLLILVRAASKEVDAIMALQATDLAVIAEIHRTTDVAAAANIALTKLAAKVGDLTTKLTEAIANSSAADDPAVQAALAELKSSNDTTVATTAATASAIANTDPDAPLPVNL